MQENRKSGLTRRNFLKASSMLAMGGVLAACAPAPSGAPAAEGGEAAPAAAGGVAQYWVGWTNLQPSWDILVETDEFKEMVGDGAVELKGASGGQVLLTAVAAGDPPDGASNTQYLDYMARDVLIPVGDMVASSDIVKEEAYLPGSWADGFYEGTMYGVPANEGFLRYGLNYNSKMVEEAGLDPDSPPVTWEDALVWHEALTKFDDAGNMIQVGLDPYDAMGGQLAIQDGFYPSVSWNWKWFDPETGEFDLDNEMMAQSFDIMGEFIKIAGADNMAGMRQVEGQGGWGGSFNAEVQAMIIEGYWHPGESQIEKPEVAQYNMATWAPVPSSRSDARVQGTGGHYVIMFDGAKNTDTMFKAAEFLNTELAMATIFENTGWLPGNTDFIKTVDPSVYAGLDFYFNSVDQATEWSSPARCPLTAFASTQYVQLRESHYRGELTGAEAAAEFQKRCETEWEAVAL